MLCRGKQVSRQCRPLSIGGSSLYYKSKGDSAETLALTRRIDELFLKYPFFGAAGRRFTCAARVCGPDVAGPDG